MYSLQRAIDYFVKDNHMVAFAGSGGRISIAAAYEIIRCRKKHLGFASAGTGAPCLDLLVGAKAVDRAEISFTMVTCLNIKRALENPRGKYRLLIEDYSNLAMTLRFFAGATRMPFIPIMSLRGSDIEEIRSFMGQEKIGLVQSPFKDKMRVAVLPPCNPDVGIMHAQYADSEGNVVALGPAGSDGWLLRASKTRIVTVEKIVSNDFVKTHKQHVFMPSFMVDAVCEVPYAAHPYGLVNCYDIDEEFQKNYSLKSKTQQGFDEWAQEWIFGIQDRSDYLKKLGKEKINRISKPKFLSDVIL